MTEVACLGFSSEYVLLLSSEEKSLLKLIHFHPSAPRLGILCVLSLMKSWFSFEAHLKGTEDTASLVVVAQHLVLGYTLIACKVGVV